MNSIALMFLRNNNDMLKDDRLIKVHRSNRCSSFTFKHKIIQFIDCVKLSLHFIIVNQYNGDRISIKSTICDLEWQFENNQRNINIEWAI